MSLSMNIKFLIVGSSLIAFSLPLAASGEEVEVQKAVQYGPYKYLAVYLDKESIRKTSDGKYIYLTHRHKLIENDVIHEEANYNSAIDCKKKIIIIKDSINDYHFVEYQIFKESKIHAVDTWRKTYKEVCGLNEYKTIPLTAKQFILKGGFGKTTPVKQSILNKKKMSYMEFQEEWRKKKALKQDKRKTQPDGW